LIHFPIFPQNKSGIAPDFASAARLAAAVARAGVNVVKSFIFDKMKTIGFQFKN
jgi:hypothetical protein